MSRKSRPTAVSWDSDDDLLQDDGSGISAFATTKVNHESDDELDEDALLGSDDEGAKRGNSAGQSKKASKAQKEAEELEEYELIEVNADEEFDGEDVIEMANAMEGSYEESQEAYNKSDDQASEIVEQTQEVEGLDNSQLESDAEIVTEQTSLLDESQNLTEADDSLATEHEASKTFGESDSDSEDEDSGRGRFKTERNKIITISTTKARTNIPDTLEISQEQQQAIDQFYTSKNQGGRGRGQFNRGSFQHNQRGRMPYGQRNRPPWSSGPPRYPGPRQLNPPQRHPPPRHEYPSASQPFSSTTVPQTFQTQSRKILINPHFKGQQPSRSAAIDQAWTTASQYVQPEMTTATPQQQTISVSSPSQFEYSQQQPSVYPLPTTAWAPTHDPPAASWPRSQSPATAWPPVPSWETPQQPDTAWSTSQPVEPTWTQPPAAQVMPPPRPPTYSPASQSYPGPAFAQQQVYQSPPEGHASTGPPPGPAVVNTQSPYVIHQPAPTSQPQYRPPAASPQYQAPATAQPTSQGQPQRPTVSPILYHLTDVQKQQQLDKAFPQFNRAEKRPASAPVTRVRSNQLVQVPIQESVHHQPTSRISERERGSVVRQNSNIRVIQTVPQKRLSSDSNVIVPVKMARPAEPEEEEPLDEEARILKQKMDEQKRQREAIIRRKEARRQMQAEQRRKDLQMKLAESGMTLDDVAGPNNSSDESSTPIQTVKTLKPAAQQVQQFTKTKQQYPQPIHQSNTNIQLAGNPTLQTARLVKEPQTAAQSVPANAAPKKFILKKVLGGQRPFGQNQPTLMLTSTEKHLLTQGQAQLRPSLMTRPPRSPAMNRPAFPSQQRPPISQRFSPPMLARFPPGSPPPRMPPQPHPNFPDRPRMPLLPDQFRGRPPFRPSLHPHQRPPFPPHQMPPPRPRYPPPEHMMRMHGPPPEMLRPGPPSDGLMQMPPQLMGLRPQRPPALETGPMRMKQPQNAQQRPQLSQKMQGKARPFVQGNSKKGFNIRKPYGQMLQKQKFAGNLQKKAAVPQANKGGDNNAGAPQPNANRQVRMQGAVGKGQTISTRKVVGNTGQQNERTVIAANRGAGHIGQGDGANGPRRVVVGGQTAGTMVCIGNLSISTNPQVLKTMCATIGSISSFQLHKQQKKAFVRFTNPSHAAMFASKYNRHMVDLSHINVSVLST